MQLRPHHIVDIVTTYGKGGRFTPSKKGHSQHIVAPKLLSNLDMKIDFVVAADDLCKGCKHMLSDGRCDDLLSTSKKSKQVYNDSLDTALLDYLLIEQNSVMTVRKYLEMINDKVPGIEKICTHSSEKQEERLNGLIDGLIKLGIRNKD